MGKFLEKVRRGRVIGPRKHTFTLEKWNEAYEEFSSGDKPDMAAHMSGKNIHTKLTAIRKATAQSSLSNLSTETRIKALIAAANHQFEAFELQMKARFADVIKDGGGEGFHIRDIASMQVTLADGAGFNADSALGSMLDGIAIPVAVALKGQSNCAEDSFDNVNWNDVLLEINLGILYDQAENLWEDCVWNTYILAGKGSNMLAIPLDVDAKRGSSAAAARKLALGIEATASAFGAFKLAKAQGFMSRLREVQAVVTDGNQQRIELGQDRLDLKSQSMLFAMRMMACPAYYDSLLYEAQPLIAGANLSQLFDGWMVVSHAARHLWESTSSGRGSDSSADPNAVSDMRQYVRFFTKEALVVAVHTAAGIPVGGAEAIIEFLTFRGKEKQEFWTQPLVSIGDRLYPVFGAIAVAPNMSYVLERWMAQLKVKLDERGPLFEKYLRARLTEAVETSPILSDVAKVVPRDYTFKCADKSFGQFDALFCIGSRVFVVEAKCILEPTESTSIGTHRAAIEHAVEQAKARVKLINEHRREFIIDMKQFGWHLEPEFCVHPLVAVSTVAHVGISWDDVPVVDELVLSRFFAGGYEEVGLDAGDFSIAQRMHHPFYTNAAEAEASAMRYFEQPPQLKEYSERLRLRDVPMHGVLEGDWSGLMFDYE